MLALSEFSTRAGAVVIRLSHTPNSTAFHISVVDNQTYFLFPALERIDEQAVRPSGTTLKKIDVEPFRFPCIDRERMTDRDLRRERRRTSSRPA